MTWNTTDALSVYVRTESKWPAKWEDLATPLELVDPSYKGGDISFAKEHVDVNFDIDLSELPNGHEWYVRVKSGHIEPEQHNANQRIRRSIVALQERSKDKLEPKD